MIAIFAMLRKLMAFLRLQAERVVLCVMTNDEVTHAGDSGFRNADLAAEVLDFLGIIGDRIDAYVVRDRLLGTFAFLKSAIRRVVGTGVSMYQ
jgi:hypothetical protein